MGPLSKSAKSKIYIPKNKKNDRGSKKLHLRMSCLYSNNQLVKDRQDA